VKPPPPNLRFQRKDTEQYHVCIAAPGISRSDRRRFAASLLDSILGGSASSRLFQEIREKRGMAYAVYSFASQYTDTGLLGVYVTLRGMSYLGHGLSHAIFGVVNIIMKAAPIGAFGAMAFTVGSYGLASLNRLLALMGGFLLFHITEKSILIHFSHEEQYAEHQHPLVGVLSAVALTGHSFLDGVGIGLGFQVSPAVGLIVAIAVIAHDFSDGLNTVTLMLVYKNTSRCSYLLLLVDVCVAQL